MTSPVRSFALLALSLCGSACTSLDRFDTDGKSAYCGQMIGSPAFHEGILPEGVPPTLRLRMTLDIDALRERTTRAYGSAGSGVDNATEPAETVVVGRVSTDDAGDGLCAPSGTVLFDNAPLRAIPELDHDPLSTLEFGDGRDYNFFAWVDSTCQGTMLAVVSLMRNDGIEVRVLKPASMPSADAASAQRPGFALFTLSRREEGCGF
jgi:hypothetical protein